MIKIILILFLFSQIKEVISKDSINIEVVTKKTVSYHILTRENPINITVEGPTSIRVYTRIVCPSKNKSTQLYKLILQKNQLEEKIITLKTQVSKTAQDEMGRSVSKWRSFYIEVPEGLNKYKLLHWSSPRDTILVRFAYGTPGKWIDISATEYNKIFEAVENEKIIPYYELKQGGELLLKISGPKKLKVISRLNYNNSLLGKQNYTIVVQQDKKKETFTFNCYKSEIIKYRNAKELIPSNAQTFYLNISKGTHIIHFTLKGTESKSAGLRFMIKE